MERQGRAAVIVALDGWIIPVSLRAARAGFWGRHDRAAIARALATMRRNPGIYDLPVYARQTRATSPIRMRIEVDAASVIIAEGVSALADPTWTTDADMRIFVRCPEVIRRQRLIGDYRARGFSAAAVAALLKSRMSDEFGLVESGVAIADWIVTIS
ncbi:MAG TPA: hypothetical protein VKV28_15405 [Candidatus Binataceae bacterium]|nr:hypothetical protein [Candidatus Binataceae bacterium]